MRSGIAQSFVESGTATPVRREVVKELTQTSSTDSAESCECCCRCGRKAKGGHAQARGKRRSKSSTALRTAISEWSGWDDDVAIAITHELSSIETPSRQYRAGDSPLERLPTEVLGKCRTTP